MPENLSFKQSSRFWRRLQSSMADDPKHIVETGYNNIAPRYLEWSIQNSDTRLAHLTDLLTRLPKESDVLELGCGAGLPCTEIIAQHSRVTANDISTVQIELAKQHVPNATFITADMMSLEFSPRTYDAAVAFYSIIHLPRSEQCVLIKRLSEWLRPGGYLLVNLGTKDDPGSIEPDWLGSKMFWSSYDAQTNLNMIRNAGLSVLDAKVIYYNEQGGTVPFLWVLARRPSEP